MISIIISDEKAKILLGLLFFSILCLFVCIYSLKKYRIEKSEDNIMIDNLARFFNMSIEEDNYIYLLRIIKFLSITFIIYMYYSFFPYHSPSYLNRELYNIYNFCANLLNFVPIYVGKTILELYLIKEILEILINTIFWSMQKKASR